MALIDDLVSYWKLDESSGNAADSVGPNTLVNTNSTAFASGKIGNGADLEASSSNYFSIADGSQTGLDPAGSFCINVWYKVETTPTGGAEYNSISKYGGAGSRSYIMVYFDNGGTPTLQFQIYDNSNVAKTLNVANTLTQGTFVMVTYVFTASSRMEIFVNASSIGNTTTSIPANAKDTTADFHLSGTSGGGGYFDGMMDEVGFWSRALSGAEITELYNAGAGLQYPFNTNVTVSPSPLGATFSLPASTVTAVQNVTVSPSVLAATFSLPASTATGDAIASPSALSATFSLPTVDIQIPNVTVFPSVLTLIASLPSRSINVDYVTAVNALAATFSIPTATITAIQHATLTPSPLTLAFSIPAPTRTGGLWQNQTRNSSSFTNQTRSSSSWSNQPRPLS